MSSGSSKEHLPVLYTCNAEFFVVRKDVWKKSGNIGSCTHYLSTSLTHDALGLSSHVHIDHKQT